LVDKANKAKNPCIDTQEARNFLKIQLIAKSCPLPMLGTSNPKFTRAFALHILGELPSLLEAHFHYSNTTHGKSQN
jgi:hypothetical protein